ncbi:MAG TPA: hypothetical protein VGO62_07610, partial [Myxococcota bacterium]
MNVRILALVGAVATALASAPALAEMTPDITAPFFDQLASTAPPAKRVPKKTPAPDPRRAAALKANPLYAGLAAGGAAGGTALVGSGLTAVSALALLGTFGAPSLPVTVTAAVIGIALLVATPIAAGIAGGAALLAMDPRTKPADWSGLIGCATSGCCSGLDMVGGTVGSGLLGGICGSAPAVPGAGATPSIPGPDQPAEWTAAPSFAGLLGGGVVGGLLGWSVAGNPSDPWVPITVGAIAGGTLGA